MSHSIIIILSKTGELKGNATEGAVVDLENAASAADTWLQNNPGHRDAAKVHSDLENLETWLTGSYSQTVGAPDTVADFTTDLNELIT